MLAQHSKQNNHQFDLDDVEVIYRSFQWSKRLFLEASRSVRKLNSINEHIYIPDIYNALGNHKWRFPAALLKHSFTFYAIYAEEGYRRARRGLLETEKPHKRAPKTAKPQ